MLLPILRFQIISSTDSISTFKASFPFCRINNFYAQVALLISGPLSVILEVFSKVFPRRVSFFQDLFSVQKKRPLSVPPEVFQRVFPCQVFFLQDRSRLFSASQLSLHSSPKEHSLYINKCPRENPTFSSVWLPGATSFLVTEGLEVSKRVQRTCFTRSPYPRIWAGKFSPRDPPF